MPHFLLKREQEKLMDEYGDYCLESILLGKEARTFEEFQRGVKP